MVSQLNCDFLGASPPFICIIIVSGEGVFATVRCWVNYPIFIIRKGVIVFSVPPGLTH